MFVRYPVLLSTILLLQSPVFGTELNDAVRDDYETHLAKLFDCVDAHLPDLVELF